MVLICLASGHVILPASTVRPLPASGVFLSLSEILAGGVKKPKARNSEAELYPPTLVPLGSHLVPCDLAPALFY